MTLIYDVETSGLPDWQKPSNHPSQPHIIQIAAIRIDKEAGAEIERMNVLIKPDGWVLPQAITELTGITQERLEDEGIPIREAVESFMELWKKCTLTVAHNDEFDRRCFRIEMARLYGKIDLLDRWKLFPSFCTMKQSTNIINLPPSPKMVAAGMNKPKSPKLQEAYSYFFGSVPEKSHDAMADVESTLAVYLKLLELKRAA